MANGSQHNDKKEGYRSVFKATSLFGGVQVYQILISIIRSKAVALLIGPLGMGLQGLYLSAIQLVQNVTNLGLSQSAVRDVSEANNSGDMARVSRTVSALRNLVWVTGLLGVVITLLLSGVLSRRTFGNEEHIIPFMFLSVILLFDQLCAGRNVVLQGMRKLRFLASATAIGSTVGLLIAIPLYYFFRIKGVVPTMILVSLANLVISYYFSNKVKVDRIRLSFRETLREGKLMLSLGIAMSISGILVTLASYVLRGYIRTLGGVEEVGLFTAGFSLMNSYVGMIFTAMGTDYFPRLSAINKDNEKCREVINQQGDIAILLVAPIVLVFLVFTPFIIRLFYSKAFLPASGYVQWALMGMMFKTLSWSVAFVFLAKGETKLFIINETIANIYSLVLNILGYKIMGLPGLGLSFTVGYVIYFIQVYILARERYGFAFSKDLVKTFLVLFFLITLVFFLMALWKSRWVYLPVGILVTAGVGYSLYELDRRIDIFGFFGGKLSNLQNRNDHE